HRRAVIDDVRHDVNRRLAPGDQLAVVPDHLAMFLLFYHVASPALKMKWEPHRAIHCGAANIKRTCKGVNDKPNNTKPSKLWSRRNHKSSQRDRLRVARIGRVAYHMAALLIEGCDAWKNESSATR